ncbi:restriction endonuclease subunit S (plasmid) [Roseomonas mucosa]|nr:restriction endonuclease subunit S [Roseomonas mucosa]
MEWIGRTPAHWPIVALKRAATLVTDRAEQRTHPVALENIEGWSGRYLETEGDFTGEGIVFRRGDILFGKLRPYLAKAWLADCDGEAVGDFHVIRGHAQNSPAYLQRLLLTREVISLVDGSTHGAKMPRASWDFLASLLIPIPPPDEQVAIASFLDRETGKIDALVAEQKQLIALLKEKRQAVISQAVTKGLDPNVPMRDSGVEWLGEVPAHWEVRPLASLVRKGTSITYGIVQAGPDEPNGIPYIRTSDMSGTELPLDGYLRTTPEIDLAYARSKVETGDLVVAIRATVGKTLKVPAHLRGANLTQGTARVAPGNKIGADYLSLFLNSTAAGQGFDAQAKGATFKEITLDMLRKFRVPVPPKAEQETIEVQINSIATELDRLGSETERAISLLRERRSALISAAVTGKIDVRDLATHPEAQAA